MKSGKKIPREPSRRKSIFQLQNCFLAYIFQGTKHPHRDSSEHLNKTTWFTFQIPFIISLIIELVEVFLKRKNESHSLLLSRFIMLFAVILMSCCNTSLVVGILNMNLLKRISLPSFVPDNFTDSFSLDPI